MNIEFDDEVCTCGHSKGYHHAHKYDLHGKECCKCDCQLWTWGKFVSYTKPKKKVKQ